jgi:hypothetical protein
VLRCELGAVAVRVEGVEAEVWRRDEIRGRHHTVVVDVDRVECGSRDERVPETQRCATLARARERDLDLLDIELLAG